MVLPAPCAGEVRRRPLAETRRNIEGYLREVADREAFGSAPVMSGSMPWRRRPC